MMLFQKTIKTKAFALLAVSLVAVPAVMANTMPAAPTKAELQQRLLLALTGEYSNFYALTEQPTTVGDFPPIIQHAESVSLASGEQALLVKQGFLSSRASNVSNSYYRRTLYVFVTPRNSNELVQVSYPLSPSVSKQALTEPDALSQLPRLPGCEIFWQYEPMANGHDSFNGYRSPDRCFFVDEKNTPVHLETIVHVTNNELQMTENLLDSSGEPLVETELGGTITLNPIRFFDMTVSFLPDGANKENAEAWISVQPDGLIHDHGQHINLRTQKEQQVLPYQIKLVRAEGNESLLQVRIYSLGLDTPLEDLTVELNDGVGVLHIDPLRVEIELRR